MKDIFGLVVSFTLFVILSASNFTTKEALALSLILTALFIIRLEISDLNK